MKELSLKVYWKMDASGVAIPRPPVVATYTGKDGWDLQQHVWDKRGLPKTYEELLGSLTRGR